MAEIEVVIVTVEATRKANSTPIEMAVANLYGSKGENSGNVILRTKDKKSGVPPVVAKMSAEVAEELGNSLIEAAKKARQC